ncbi:hypothetical protein D1AOALGA4SA_4273, partial [Olavius algarvensis Delta 1 endosymbiont]
GGRLAPEWVDGINRNGWTASPGIAGRNHAEYAAWGLGNTFASPIIIAITLSNILKQLFIFTSLSY